MNNVIKFPTRPEQEPMVSVNDLAQHYGFKRSWVYKNVRQGMPHRRVSGRIRFMISETDKWLEDR